MKKMLIAGFLVFLMLMLPMTTAIKTNNDTDDGAQTTNYEIPTFYITQLELEYIHGFIELKFEDDVKKAEAYSIVDEVVSDDLEVDIIRLAELSLDYGITPIPEHMLTLSYITTIQQLLDLIEEYWGVNENGFIKDLFGQLIDKIIELIQGRLGWVYTLLVDGAELFKDGVNILVNYIPDLFLIISLGIVTVINNILAVPQLFRDLITDLFNQDFTAFGKTINDFINSFGNDIEIIIGDVIDYVTDEELHDFLSDTQSFIGWINGKPWESPIHVNGVVRQNLGFLAGATVTCRGVEDITDSNGVFDFYVDIVPDGDSFPPDSYYGMHNCQITVSNEGKTLKQTDKRLSYVFSEGNINWTFLTFKVKAKQLPLFTLLYEKFSTLFVKIADIFPVLFRNIVAVPLAS